MHYRWHAAITVALILILAQTALAQSVSTRVRGAVLLCDYDTELRGETCWVGCTLLLHDGEEYDLAAKRVVGRGRVAFSSPGGIMPQAVSYVVGLWHRRVDDCGCVYCRKNGYHLEGRLASSEGSLSSASTRITWQQLDEVIRFFAGQKVILELPRRIDIERSGDGAAQRELCGKLEALLDLTTSLAGMPGTGATPPICRIAARGEDGSKIADINVELLRTEEGFFYGLKAQGFWGSIVADGLRGLGFIEVEPSVFVRQF